MARPAATILLRLALILGLALALVLALEARFIFFPERQLEASPADYGLEYEEVRFAAQDGTRLYGWWIPAYPASGVTWLWFHGNAGNISHRLQNIRHLHDLLGVNIFIFDYRGYGLSAGKPSEPGLYQDARAALAAVLAQPGVEAGHLIYFGRSLGCAVALELALAQPPAALVLESPFSSIQEMARTAYPWFPFPGLLRHRFDSLKRIPLLQAPLFLLYASHDEFIPEAQVLRLYEAAPQPKRLYRIEGAGHNDTYLVGGERYFQALADFLAEFVEGRR